MRGGGCYWETYVQVSLSNYIPIIISEASLRGGLASLVRRVFVMPCPFPGDQSGAMLVLGAIATAPVQGNE